jgi:hypothetical protein
VVVTAIRTEARTEPEPSPGWGQARTEARAGAELGLELGGGWQMGAGGDGLRGDAGAFGLEMVAEELLYLVSPVDQEEMPAIDKYL